MKRTLDRRTFLRRAGALLTALGYNGAAHAARMDGIFRKAKRSYGSAIVGGEPYPRVKFLVEIPIRAGFQTNALFPSRGHKYDTRVPFLNCNSSASNIDVFVPAVGSPVFFARYLTGQGGDRLRTAIESHDSQIGIATSLGVNLTLGQHTGNFVVRSPQTGAPCPAVLHAAYSRPRAVRGAAWNNGASVINTRGDLPALPTCTDGTTFSALFQDMPMYFTPSELTLIEGEISRDGTVIGGNIGTVGKLDHRFSTIGIDGTGELETISLAGRGRAQMPIQQALTNAYNTVSSNFTNLTQNLGGTMFATALAHAAAAFSIGALSSIVIALDSNDWEGDINPADSTTGKQGIWNLYLGTALADFITTLGALPDPEDPSKKILDSVLISLSSEFARTPLLQASGSDNGDGGTQSFTFIGGPVRSGSYGDIAGDGTVSGFDPNTGVLQTPSQLTEKMVWHTAGALIGIPQTVLDGYAPGAIPMNAVIR